MGNENAASGQVDVLQVGVMIGKLDTLISRFDNFERDIKTTYATVEKVKAIDDRVRVLEDAPQKKTGVILTTIASVAAGVSCIVAVAAFFYHH